MRKKYTKIYNSNDKMYIKVTNKHYIRGHVSAIYGYDPEEQVYKLITICEGESAWLNTVYDMSAWLKQSGVSYKWIGEHEVFLEKI